MYQLENLSDYEFELLAKDLLSTVLKLTLYTFPKGKDGGIDLCDAKRNPSVVGQAKHYARSSVTALLNSLKKEQEHIRQLDPESYYVFTSLELTKGKKDEILALFPGVMKDRSHIWDKNDIDAFLQRPDGREIVKRHYKLWLVSTEVLSLMQNRSVFLDSEELLCSMEEKMQLYVQTRAYREAESCLKKRRIVILTGDPGVGKSTVSNMLALAMAGQGCHIRYTTDNSIKDIKQVLSQDQEYPEVVILDDFLGQHYLKMKDSQPSEIRSLISFIRRTPGKYLIMNSRITILNEAKRMNLQFRDVMEQQEESHYVIDMNRMSDLEKAEILYNHFYFYGLPASYFAEMKKNRRYMRIIQHRNYNPRIIEYVCKKTNIGRVPAAEYFEYVMDKLENPEDVWRDEFENRLEDEDRMLMDTLYSLTDTSVEDDILRRAYESRIRAAGADSTVRRYEQVKIRLADTLLKQNMGKDGIRISVCNPSVNDYLKREISCNENEQIAVLESAVYLEQFWRMAQNPTAHPHIYRMLLDGRVQGLDTIQGEDACLFLKLVRKVGLRDRAVEKQVQEAVRLLINSTKKLAGVDSGFWLDLYRTRFLEFYGMKKEAGSAEWISAACEIMNLEETESFLYLLQEQYGYFLSEEEDEDGPSEESQKVYFAVYDQVCKKICDGACSYAEENATDSLYMNYFTEEEVFSGYLEERIADAEWDALQEFLRDRVEEFREFFGFREEDFPQQELWQDLDVMGIAESYRDDMREDRRSRRLENPFEEENREIATLFEREWKS